MTIWVRLGISVALAAVYCIAVTELLQRTRYYEAHRWSMCAVLLVAGLLVCVLGRRSTAATQPAVEDARINLAADPYAVSESPPAEPFLLFTRGYCGVMLAAFGVILMFIVPRPAGPGGAAAVAARPAKPAPAVAAPVQFPQLQMQGLVYRPNRSSVMFDGKTYMVGDRVRGAKVVAITYTEVTLELNGTTKVLDLERELLRRSRN